MTNSNGIFNPHPLANPFNTRLGPANYSLNPNSRNYLANSFNASNKSLPDPVMLGDMQSNTDLHVPQQDIPFSLADVQNFVDSYSANKTWNDSEIYALNQSNAIDRKSADYWKMANAENEKMLSALTDEQKRMLADVERTFPASRLELEE